MKLHSRLVFRRGFSAFSEALTSRTVEIGGLLPVIEIVNRIKTGPLESVHRSPDDNIRVSFLHRSSAVNFLKQIEPKDGLQARFGVPSPLYAGIISALHLHGATRSMRLFAKKPNHTRGLELSPKKFGALDGLPRYTAVQDRLPFITCHFNDITDAIKAFIFYNHAPGDDVVGHARFTNDRCDISNHYSRPIRSRKRKPQTDSEDSEPVESEEDDGDDDVKLRQRRLILHGIAPGTTRADLETAIGTIGGIQNLALIEEKGQAVVSFMSPDVALRFLQSPHLHVINKRRVTVHRGDDSSPVSSRTAFAWQLGLSRTIQLKAHDRPDKPEALVHRLSSQLGVAFDPDSLAPLKDKLHWDFQVFGHINKLEIDEENNSINITFADIYRASRAINYLAWPDDHPRKIFDTIPYRWMAISYAPPPTSYILEESIINPDGVLPVIMGNNGLRSRPHKPADPIPKESNGRNPMSLRKLDKILQKSFRRLGQAP